jgi:hypothetical protein
MGTEPGPHATHEQPPGRLIASGPTTPPAAVQAITSSPLRRCRHVHSFHDGWVEDGWLEVDRAALAGPCKVAIVPEAGAPDC